MKKIDLCSKGAWTAAAWAAALAPGGADQFGGAGDP